MYELCVPFLSISLSFKTNYQNQIVSVNTYMLFPFAASTYDLAEDNNYVVPFCSVSSPYTIRTVIGL